jgi:hypothetical protein
MSPKKHVMQRSVMFGNVMLMGLSPNWDFVPFGVVGVSFDKFGPKLTPKWPRLRSQTLR